MFGLSLATALAFGGVTVPIALPNHTISGRVADSAGTSIANVQVVVLEIARLTRTDAGGRYQIPELSDGTYGVSFSAVGYAPVVRRVPSRAPI